MLLKEWPAQLAINKPSIYLLCAHGSEFPEGRGCPYKAAPVFPQKPRACLTGSVRRKYQPSLTRVPQQTPSAPSPLSIRKGMRNVKHLSVPFALTAGIELSLSDLPLQNILMIIYCFIIKLLWKLFVGAVGQVVLLKLTSSVSLSD